MLSRSLQHSSKNKEKSVGGGYFAMTCEPMKTDWIPIQKPRVSLRGFVSNESGDPFKTIGTSWTVKLGRHEETLRFVIARDGTDDGLRDVSTGDGTANKEQKGDAFCFQLHNYLHCESISLEDSLCFLPSFQSTFVN